MYNTYLRDQNQQSIFSVFCTDLKKNWAGIAGDTVDFSKLKRYQVLYPVENLPKVNVPKRTVPYHAVEKHHKVKNRFQYFNRLVY